MVMVRFAGHATNIAVLSAAKYVERSAKPTALAESLFVDMTIHAILPVIVQALADH